MEKSSVKLAPGKQTLYHPHISRVIRRNLRVYLEYRQISNIRRTLVDIKIDDYSDVVAASPAGAAPTTSSFST